jgi:hypothetical protein
VSITNARAVPAVTTPINATAMQARSAVLRVRDIVYRGSRIMTGNSRVVRVM